MDQRGTQMADPKASIAATLRTALIIAGFGILIWLLSDVLLLVFTAVLLAVLLRGTAAILHRALGLPVGIWLALVTLLAIAGAAGFLVLLGQRFADEGQQLLLALTSFVQHLREHYGGTTWAQTLRKVIGSGHGINLAPVAPKVLTATFGTVGGLVLLLVTTLYLAAAPRPYITGAIRLIPLFYRERAAMIMDQLGRTLRFWMAGQLISMATVGVLSTVGLMLLHVPLFVALGVLAGLLTFIPYLGAILAGVPAAIIASTQGPEMIIWVVLLYIGCHLIEGYVVTPLVTRRTVDLPPAITLVSISAFGALFGFMGVLIATPLAAVIIVLVREIYVRDILCDHRPELETGPANPANPRSNA